MLIIKLRTLLRSRASEPCSLVIKVRALNAHAPTLTFPLGRGAAGRASERCLFVIKVRAFSAQAISWSYFQVTLRIGISTGA